MSYHFQTKKKNKTLPAVLFSLIVILFLALSFNFSSQFLRGISNNIYKIFVGSGIGGFFESKRLLEKENQELKENNSLLVQKTIYLESLERENDELRNQINLNTDDSFVFAEVVYGPGGKISRNGMVFYVSENIEKGSFIYSEKLPFGEVVDQRGKFVYVKLFSAPEKTFSVKIGEEEFLTDARGLGGGGFEAFIPKGVEMNVGDKVYVNDFGSMLFSTISSVDSSSSDSFMRVLFDLPVNPEHVRFAHIRNNKSVSIDE